ncbi:MAG: hypothetical protein HQL19_08965, partial [Candidatus Omnitrophica bacterium]|nr:hypothetical protein [Candidatus Omnitrophota bacterium]
MTLQKKLILSFMGAFILVAASTGWALISYRMIVDDVQELAMTRMEQAGLLRSVEKSVADETLAWQDILLHGADPAEFKEHSKEFYKAQELASGGIQALKAGKYRFRSQ